MAHDLEPMKRAAPDVPDAAMVPWFQAPEITTRPEWTELVPPYRDDSDLERRWSIAVRPFRFLALGFLWITWTWVRFSIFLSSIVLVWLVFIVR